MCEITLWWIQIMKNALVFPDEYKSIDFHKIKKHKNLFR